MSGSGGKSIKGGRLTSRSLKDLHTYICAGGFPAVAKWESLLRFPLFPSTVSSEGMGCLESIFVELDYRRNSIDDNLKLEALDWMNGNQAETIMPQVGVGNKAILLFHRCYNFHPITILLQLSKIVTG